MTGGGKGRPKREYRVRVRGERRERPDWAKLARALLEHAAMEERARRDAAGREPDLEERSSEGGTE